jgi:hypothetical protein
MPTASSSKEGESGYATAAAALACLAIATVVASLTSVNLSEFRRAKQGLARLKAENILESAQLVAAETLNESMVPGRLSWSVDVGGQSVVVIAEPEAEKVSLAFAVSEGPEGFRALGAQHPEAAVMAAQTSLQRRYASPVASFDSGPDWRRCAPSILSPFGVQSHAIVKPPSEPNGFGEIPRVGEIWRVVASIDGWSDDRIVRLTGHGDEPAVLIAREMRRGPLSGPCPEGTRL